jgi:hypothetical protein
MSEDQALSVMITAHRRGVCVVAVQARLRPCPSYPSAPAPHPKQYDCSGQTSAPISRVSALDGVKPRSHDDLAQFWRLNHEGYGQLAQLIGDKANPPAP